MVIALGIDEPFLSKRHVHQTDKVSQRILRLRKEKFTAYQLAEERTPYGQTHEELTR